VSAIIGETWPDMVASLSDLFAKLPAVAETLMS